MCMFIHVHVSLQIINHFEGLAGKRVPIRGESAEYSLEVVKYDKGSKGEGYTAGVLSRCEVLC